MWLFGMHSFIPAVIEGLLLFHLACLLILLPHLLKQLQTILLLLQSLFSLDKRYFMLVVREVRRMIVADVFFADKQN